MADVCVVDIIMRRWSVSHGRGRTAIIVSARWRILSICVLAARSNKTNVRHSIIRERDGNISTVLPLLSIKTPLTIGQGQGSSGVVLPGEVVVVFVCFSALCPCIRSSYLFLGHQGNQCHREQIFIRCTNKEFYSRMLD